MKQVFSHIYLLETIRFEFPYCNCLWINDAVSCLVDCSPVAEEMDQIRHRRIDRIVATHGHFDHYRLSTEFPDARLMMHPADHSMCASGDGYVTEFGFDYLPEREWRRQYLDAIHYQARPADENIEDGQQIYTGKTVLQVVHLPGHSPGHCGFLLQPEGFLFTGDICLDTFGPWYGNIHSNVDEYIDSMNAVLDMNLDMLVTGHGDAVVTKNIRQRLITYRDTLYTREEQIVRLLWSGKHTIPEMAAQKPIYKKFPEPKGIFYWYECMMDWKHLERLERLGRVEQNGDRWYLKDGVRPDNLQLG